MKKAIRFSIKLILLSAILTSCVTIDSNTIRRINYGTSFGECIGYCKHDIEITGNSLTSTCTSWNTDLETKTQKASFDSKTWDALKVSFDSVAFFSLNEVIGCPDCADGGAEWLEIELINGEKHKVTYEYNKAPEEINEIVTKLRELFDLYTCNE